MKNAKKLVMTITDKCIKCSRISKPKFREFIRLFSFDLDAHKITFLTGLNRKYSGPLFTSGQEENCRIL